MKGNHCNLGIIFMNFSNIVSQYTVCVGTSFQVFYIGVSLCEMHLNIFWGFVSTVLPLNGIGLWVIVVGESVH